MGYKKVLAILLLAGTMLVGCGNKSYEAGIEALEAGEYETAVTELTKVTDQKDLAAEAYLGIGMASWELEDYTAAKDALENALANEAAETGSLYQVLGASCMKLEAYEEALTYYEKGLALDDCTEEMIQEMRFNRIAAYEGLEDWENAKAELADYVAQYPDDEAAAKEAEFLETR